METLTCSTCRTYQRVEPSQIAAVDEGAFRNLTWWRCGVCDQLSPVTGAFEPAVAELALSA